ncbi:UDP-N-acetylmuramate dehydrogenase [Candidatus Peregrinibacteria bacterium]|nr:MAG: UDP-N-acetylmuramate dehydrogenase [Candidatus Peregrinibacteria bacterium]
MKMRHDVPLSQFSTFRIGGPADFLIFAETKDHVEEALQFAEEKHLPVFFLGGGSNVLFSDFGFRGLVICLKNRNVIEESPGIFCVEAGVPNVLFYAYAKERHRDFSPFFTIPGTIGGAIAGNAGVPQGEIKDVLLSAEVFHISQKKWEEVSTSFFRFSYRHSCFHEDPALCKEILIWSARVSLPEKLPNEIEQTAHAFLQKRKETQPWGMTGGSFFRNPSEGAAGFFLEQSGMKGQQVGDAFFSEKHANFLMNAGRATQRDIIDLAKMGISAVWKSFSILLSPEVRILDEFGNEVPLSLEHL